MIALARKYRPKKFADVAVQTHVANTLKGAIARNRVAHGYLLCGPRGTGKTTLARVLAMALNCENKGDDGEPCGECTSCSRIWSGATSLDVIEIDAASNRGVDDARDLRQRAMYAPSGDDRYKVYIVDEAHMLTKESWNALLKVLEEPPPRVVFVFATTEPQKIAQTAAPVLSRLQRFDLKRIGPTEIRARVTQILTAENLSADPDALAMIARAADGSMRDALSLTDQVLAFGDQRIDADAVRAALGLVADDELLGLLDLVAERRAGDVFTAVARLADEGSDFGLLLAGFAETVRAQLAIELGGAPPEIGERLRTALEERKGRLPASDLLRMLGAIVEHEPIFKKSTQQQLLFESLLVRFALIDRTVALEDVLQALGNPSGSSAPAARGAGGRGAPPSRPMRASDAGPPSNALRDSGPAPRPAPVAAEGALAAAVDTPAAAPRASKPVAKPPTRPPLADSAPQPARAPEVLDINRLAERWDDIAAEMRSAGKGLVAQLLEESTPTAVTADGVITLDAESALTVRGLAEAEALVLDVLRRHFAGVTRLVVSGANAAPHRRYDAKSVKAEQTENLRKQDPLLSAAIDALDLELIE